MRIVLDTNIYIAAALHNGLAKEILETLFENSSISVIISKEILEELSNKLRTKFKWPKEKIDFYLDNIRTMSEIIQPSVKLTIIKRDPEDNIILECALAGEADLIVSMDQDLIKLKIFRGAGIIHPKSLPWIFPEYFRKP